MNLSYLENKLFKFTPLFNINYNNKKNLICASLFKIKKLYKTFDKYIDILEDIYYIIEEKYNNYSFRVFIDKTIYDDYEIMVKLRKLKNIELVLYEFLLDVNQGLVGTLVRYFPMFNFKNNDANIVLITDVDHFMVFNFNKYFKILSYNKVDINEIYIIKKGNISQNIQYNNFNSLYNDKLNVYSYASHIINIKKIDYKVIIDYIFDVIKANKIYSYFTKFKYDSDEYEKKFKLTKPFIYGIDEYFINFTLNNYLLKNKLPMISIIKFNISDTYYYLIKERDYYKNLSNNEINTLKFLLNYIIKKLELKNKKNKEDNILELYKSLNTKLNTKLNANKKINFEEICYVIFIFLKDKKYNFIYDKYLYKYLLNKNNFGVYNFEEIFFYNSNHKNIILEKKKINNNLYNKLIKKI
jgi:hypothetical protein